MKFCEIFGSCAGEYHKRVTLNKETSSVGFLLTPVQLTSD